MAVDTKTRPKTVAPHDAVNLSPKEKSGFNSMMSPENYSKSAQEPKRPTASQGTQDARTVAKQAGTLSQGSAGMLRAGAGAARAGLKRVLGKKPQTEQQENKMRQKLQKARKELMARAKKVADSKIREVAYANAGETFGLSVVAYYGIKNWKKIATVAAILIVIIFTLFDSSTFDMPQTGADPLTVTKGGPPVANVGEPITYSVNASYQGSATDVSISDPLPAGTTYVSSTPNGTYDKGTNTITWDANKLNIPLGNPISFTVSVTIRAVKNNIYVINQATTTVTGGSASGGSSTGCGSFNKSAADFNSLMTGQGRCTNVLGGESAFVSAVIKNGGSRFGLSAKQSELQAIYQQATAKNVNPLIVLTIWGVEAGFQDNGTQFGCKPFGSGFSSQLSCSVNTLNNWMSYYDQQKTKPVKLTASCVYNDPFIFAYEKYTPVCVINDSNGNARKNFVTYYKLLGGF